jgi:hypothetical protein
LVHIDIWGPFYVPSYSGYRFFLTIVDDYTTFTWWFLMKSKSETRAILTNFLAYVNTHFNINIQTLRLDNGQKFNMPVFLLRAWHYSSIIFCRNNWTKWKGWEKTSTPIKCSQISHVLVQTSFTLLDRLHSHSHSSDKSHSLIHSQQSNTTSPFVSETTNLQLFQSFWLFMLC